MALKKAEKAEIGLRVYELLETVEAKGLGSQIGGSHIRLVREALEHIDEDVLEDDDERVTQADFAAAYQEAYEEAS